MKLHLMPIFELDIGLAVEPGEEVGSLEEGDVVHIHGGSAWSYSGV